MRLICLLKNVLRKKKSKGNDLKSGHMDNSRKKKSGEKGGKGAWKGKNYQQPSEDHNTSTSSI